MRHGLFVVLAAVFVARSAGAASVAVSVAASDTRTGVTTTLRFAFESSIAIGNDTVFHVQLPTGFLFSPQVTTSAGQSIDGVFTPTLFPLNGTLAITRTGIDITAVNGSCTPAAIDVSGITLPSTEGQTGPFSFRIRDLAWQWLAENATVPGITVTTSCNTTDGFYVDPQNGDCRPCSAECAACIPGRPDQCTDCDPGHWHVGDSVIDNATVAQCSECVPHCALCTSASACATCRPGYYIGFLSSCQSCATNCSTCTGASSTECSACFKGSYLNGTECITCPAGCSSCSTGDTCTECSEGYFLHNGQCTSACPNGTYGDTHQRICACLPRPCECTSGECCDLSSCSVKNSSTICRSEQGVCDVAETCTGTSPLCPLDTFRNSSFVCRPNAGPCDIAESCTGESALCPSDVFRPSSSLCRSGLSLQCDPPEYCTGAAPTCPVDFRNVTGTPCGNTLPLIGSCNSTVGLCEGGSAVCGDGIVSTGEECDGGPCCSPACTLRSNATLCRAAHGPCDIAEYCSGESGYCPVDILAPQTTVCRPAVSTCDVAEYCTGQDTLCPTDRFATNTTVCSYFASQISGTCSGSGSCVCNPGYTPNSGGSCIPVPVEVVLSSSESVDICDGIEVDGYASRGGGGQPFSALQWNVTASSAVTVQSSFASLLARVQAETSLALRIPSTELEQGASYTFSLSLANFVGGVGTAERTITVASVPRPVLRVRGGSTRTANNDRTLTMQADAALSACYAESTLELVVNWTVTPSAASLTPPPSCGNAACTATLQLPPYALEPTQTYNISAFACYVNTIACAIAQSVVHVEPGEVVAEIRGGASRTVPSSGTIRFNASSSVDNAYPNDTALLYQWACSIESSGAPCGFSTLNATAYTINATRKDQGYPEGIVSVASGASAIELDATLLSAGVTYVFTLNVSNPARDGFSTLLNVVPTNRTGKAEQRITIVPDSTATVAVQLTRPAEPTATSTLRFEASCNGCGPDPVFFWTPQGDTPSSSPLLVLPPPHPAGGIVEVTVRVGTAKAIAAVRIAPTPLQSGTVAISPLSGTALDTTFTLRVVGATDSESLLYSFYLNDTLLSPIASVSPVLRTVLPAGVHAVSARVRSVTRSSFGVATAASVVVSAGVSPQVLARPFGPLDNASRAASPEDQLQLTRAGSFAVDNTTAVTDTLPLLEALRSAQERTTEQTAAVELATVRALAEPTVRTNATAILDATETAVVKLVVNTAEEDAVPQQDAVETVSVLIPTANTSALNHTLRIEQTLRDVGVVATRSSLPGEPAQERNAANVKLAARVQIAGTRAEDLSAGTARFTVPYLALDGVSPITATLAEIQQDPFPRQNATQIARPASLKLTVQGTRESISASNLSTEVVFDLFTPVPSPKPHLCSFFNVSLEEWSQSGCRRVEQIGTTTTCACNHLTAFGIVPDIQFVDASDTSNLSKLATTEYIFVLIIVGSLLSVTVFLMVYFARRDRGNWEKMWDGKGPTGDPLPQLNILSKAWRRLRLYHPVLAIYNGGPTNTRSQGLLFLLNAWMAALVLQAAFYDGEDSSVVGEIMSDQVMSIVVGAITIMFCYPIAVFLKLFFEKAWREQRDYLSAYVQTIREQADGPLLDASIRARLFPEIDGDSSMHASIAALVDALESQSGGLELLPRDSDAAESRSSVISARPGTRRSLLGDMSDEPEPSSVPAQSSHSDALTRPRSDREERSSASTDQDASQNMSVSSYRDPRISVDGSESHGSTLDENDTPQKRRPSGAGIRRTVSLDSEASDAPQKRGSLRPGNRRTVSLDSEASDALQKRGSLRPGNHRTVSLDSEASEGSVGSNEDSLRNIRGRRSNSIRRSSSSFGVSETRSVRLSREGSSSSRGPAGHRSRSSAALRASLDSALDDSPSLQRRRSSASSQSSAKESPSKTIQKRRMSKTNAPSGSQADRASGDSGLKVAIPKEDPLGSSIPNTFTATHHSPSPRHGNTPTRVKRSVSDVTAGVVSPKGREGWEPTDGPRGDLKRSNSDLDINAGSEQSLDATHVSHEDFVLSPAGAKIRRAQSSDLERRNRRTTSSLRSSQSQVDEEDPQFPGSSRLPPELRVFGKRNSSKSSRVLVESMKRRLSSGSSFENRRTSRRIFESIDAIARRSSVGSTGSGTQISVSTVRNFLKASERDQNRYEKQAKRTFAPEYMVLGRLPADRDEAELFLTLHAIARRFAHDASLAAPPTPHTAHFLVGWLCGIVLALCSTLLTLTYTTTLFTTGEQATNWVTAAVSGIVFDIIVFSPMKALLFPRIAHMIRVLTGNWKTDDQESSMPDRSATDNRRVTRALSTVFTPIRLVGRTTSAITARLARA